MLLTPAFLRQMARDYSLSPEQEEVFVLKLSENLSYDQLVHQLHISKAACLKRMGEVYKKFEIEGKGRGKDQRLKKLLLKQAREFRESNVIISPLREMGQAEISPPKHVSSESISHQTGQTATSIHPSQSFARSLWEWFKCLDYEFEREPELTSDRFEWILRVRARRGFDRIVVYGIQSEAQGFHVRALREAVDKHDADEGWVVVPLRVSQVARREASSPNNRDLFCYTFDELIDQDVNFDNYFEWLEETVRSRKIPSKYIHLACKKTEFDPNTQEAIGYSHYGENEGWIDSYINRWLEDPAKEHISVLGEFGTGKTWFTLHYAWISLERYKQKKERGRERPRIPLLIPLRDCTKAVTIESLFLEFFFRKHKISLPNYSVFEQLNRMGKLLLIFDGFDEMATKIDRQSMINNFWELAKVVVRGSKAILTCRTEHFPDAKAGRALLNAELQASTAALTAESPQFEVLELEEFDDAQIQQVINSRTNPAATEKFITRPEFLNLARRPLMVELILDALPDIATGKPINLAGIYLYAIRRKMEDDIQSARTFTSLADKLYFLCELSWKMLSTGQMSLSYRDFPDEIRQLFGPIVESQTELDHWHYDMMGQTMLIRNEHGEYTPAHRSFLEFFVAYKFVAELGCLSDDFVKIAQQQSHIDKTKAPEVYQWSTYFRREVDRKGEVIPICPLKTFTTQQPLSSLRNTLGLLPLSKAILDFMVPMLRSNQDGTATEKRLVDILMSIKDSVDSKVDYLAGNIITLLLKIAPSALQGRDLSHRVIQGADFTDASLRDINFTSAHLIDCIFPQGWGGDLSVAFSPDGRFLAIVDTTGEITLWDVTQEEPIWQQKGHTDWIRSVAFDAKGQTLATGSHDKTIKLWDVETGDLIRSLDNGSRVYSVAFSSDYDMLASGGDEAFVKLWDTRTGRPSQRLAGHKSWVGAVIFGHNPYGEEVLASGSDDGVIQLWNPKTGQCAQSLTNSNASIQSIAFAPDGKTLASGSADRTVNIWDIEAGQCAQTLKGHSDWVRSVSFSSQGDRLASGSNDKTIRLWNMKTGQCLRTIEAHNTRVWSVAFSPQQNILASGSDDRTVKLWDIHTGQCRKTLWGNSRGLWSLAFSADGQTLFAGNDDSRIQSWDVPSQQNRSSFQGHRGRVRAIALAKDRQTLASGSDDKSIKLWNIRTGDCLQTLENHTDWVWSVAFSPDGQTLASGSLDETIMLWNVQTKQHYKTLSGHTQFVWSVAWSPTGSALASGSADRSIKLWNPTTGECLKTLEGHDHQVTSVAFDPTGDVLASGSDDETIKLWAVRTGKCLRTLDRHSEQMKSTDGNKGQIRAVTFSPDGQLVASGGLDRTINLWEVKTGTYVQTISNHSGPISSLAFSPDGQVLASGGESGIIHLSDINTGSLLQELKPDNLYKGMNITDVHGLSQAQKSTLISLGAVSDKQF